MELFPSMPLASWQDTKQTLHRFCQVVGKLRLAGSARRNHWWNVPFHLTGRGITTRPMGQVDSAAGPPDRGRGRSRAGPAALEHSAVRDREGSLPGMVAAGGVRRNGRWAFWDVSDPHRALIIHLADDRHDRLVVEVDDRADTAARIRQSIGDHSGPSA